jgi:sugar phosphate isomerase/epimerase
MEEAAEMIDRLGRPNIKIMPDIFHMNIEDRSIEGSLAAFAGRIAYVHVADSNRLAPGMGHLNFPNIIAVLESLTYEGYLTAEILPHPTPDEAAAFAARSLKALVSR